MATQNTHFGAKKIEEILHGARSVYFIGIGGINMSSLALITSLRGYKVAGSDRTPSALTQRLAESGIEVNYAHEAKNVTDFDAVVYTVAISPTMRNTSRRKKEVFPAFQEQTISATL